MKKEKIPITNAKINLNISSNKENIPGNIVNNLKEEKNNISQLSPAYIFCKSQKDLNSLNENGWSPIYRAIIANNISALSELLKLGSDPNISNNLGETPLYLCIENENYNSLIKLLEYGADPNIQKRNGVTPLHLAIKKKLENKYIIELLNHKANPNILNKLYNQTPTHLALINKYNEEILKILKEKNAKIYEIKDKYDKTPFDYVKELNDSKYLNEVVNIFGKEEEKIKKEVGIKLVEINLDDNTTKMDLDLGKDIKDNNNIPFLIDTKDIINTNKFKQEIDILDNNKDLIINKGNDEIMNKINNLKYLINNQKVNRNINNFDSLKENQDNNKKTQNLNNKNNISNKNNNFLKLQENNYLFNSLDNLGKFKKKINNSETKDIILLPDYLKIEKSNIKQEKEDVLKKTNNNEINNGVNKNNLNNNFEKRSEKHINSNILSSHKSLNLHINSESLCYSLSKEISEGKNINQNKKEAENENNIELHNKMFSNSSETDKEIIKTIISATSKKLKNSKESSSSNINQKNNNENKILNYNNSNKIINIGKNLEIKVFNSENINEEKLNDQLLSILNKEDKNKEIERNITSSFAIKEDKINENNYIDENLATLTNNSNIFSELQMNTTNSNFNKTRIEEDGFKDASKDNEKISKINTSITNNTNININKINSLQNKDSISDKDLDINISISNYNNENQNDIKKQKLKENTIFQNEIIIEKKIKNDKNSTIRNLNKDIIDKNYNNKDTEISKNQKINIHRQISYHNNCNNKKNKNENEYDKDDKEKEKITINNEEDNLTDLTNKIVKMLKEQKNSSKSNKKTNDKDSNKENENPNKIKKQIYKSKNYLANDRKNKNIRNNKNINLNKANIKKGINNYREKENLIYKNYNKYNDNEISPSRSVKKINNNILYNRQKIFRHSSPDYYFNYKRFKKENLISDNSYRNNNSFISILNTNSNSSNKANNLYINKKGYLINKNNLFNQSDSFEENINRNFSNNSNNIIIYPNRNIFNKKIMKEGNTLNNTTYSSFHKNNNSYSRNYYKPLMNSNSINSNSFSNSNSYCNRNSNNQNIFNYINTNSNNYNQMSIIKPHKTISNSILIRLRDWLISCDLLCYYNILIKNDMYNIDRYIEDIRYNRINITFKDIEELGIKKPGHIFRLLLKLDVDSGKIDNNLYNYIIEKFNINTITNNGVLTSSISDIRCCGINCCTKSNNYNNKRLLLNNNANYINNYYEANKTNDSENDCGDNEINYLDIFSFLRKNNLWKYKENFIHNGFDQIEYILIQLFSQYTFDKYLLNDHMHIYLDEDKNIVLKALYKEKKKLSLILGIPYNNEQLKQILISQTSSFDYYNNYINSASPTNPNTYNNDNCCFIF